MWEYIYALPTYNPVDPSNAATFIVAAVVVVCILGVSVALALRNPRMRTKRA